MVPTEAPIKDTKGVTFYCVTYLREVMGVNIRGDANTIKPNSTPIIGGVVLFNYSGVYHASYIKYFMPSGMWVKEANFKAGQVTERFIRYDDKNIRGFYDGRNIQ